MVRRRYYRNDDDFLNVLIILIILGAIYSFVTKYWLIILIIAGLVLLYLLIRFIIDLDFFSKFNKPIMYYKGKSNINNSRISAPLPVRWGERGGTDCGRQRTYRPEAHGGFHHGGQGSFQGKS